MTHAAAGLGLPLLRVDPRTGSGEMLKPLKRRGVPAVSEQLPAADFAFVGLGKGGREVRVGIERKKLSDVLQCIQDGRFAGHQLPLLLANYDVVWLVVEGSWRGDPKTGLLQIPGGKAGWQDWSRGGVRLLSALNNWLRDMTHKAGVLYWRSWNDDETADFIVGEYNWWCLSKGWEGHKAHLALHKAIDENIWEGQLGKVGRVAAAIDGIGSGKARKLQRHFPSPRKLVNAPISELRKAGLGAADVVKVQQFLSEEEE